MQPVTKPQFVPIYLVDSKIKHFDRHKIGFLHQQGDLQRGRHGVQSVLKKSEETRQVF